MEDRNLTVEERSSEAPVRIADAFNSYFSNWNIEVSPADIRPGAQASIGERGWGINYIVGADGKGDLYLEFYATHRMTNDRHVLISSSGTTEHLDALNSMVFFDPSVGGDRERASRENIERNQRVAQDLEAKGLFPSGNINAFLSTGGMEASDALKEMTELLSEAGLAIPPIPKDLQTNMYKVRRWCYATRNIDALDMYTFDGYLVEAVADPPEPYFAFSHAGHGINSYAINFHLVTEGLALFVQVPWGGAYMNKERQEAELATIFDRCAALLKIIPEKPKQRLLVASSELRDRRLCGWIPKGLDQSDARQWLASHEASTDDAFNRAKELIQEL